APALSVTQDVTITITGTNDAPTLQAAATNAVEDGPSVSVDLAALGADVDSDNDGASLTYTVSGQPSEGAATITGTTLTFTPGADFQDLAIGETRDVTVQVTATDAHGATAVNDVTITVTGTNDAPTILRGSDLSVTVQTGTTRVTNLSAQDLAMAYFGSAPASATVIYGQEVFEVTPGNGYRMVHTVAGLFMPGELKADSVVEMTMDAGFVLTGGDQDSMVGLTDGMGHMTYYTLEQAAGHFFAGDIDMAGNVDISGGAATGTTDNVSFTFMPVATDYTLGFTLDGANDQMTFIAPFTGSGNPGEYINPANGLAIYLGQDESNEYGTFKPITVESIVEAQDATGSLLFADVDTSDVQTAAVTGFAMSGATAGLDAAAIEALFSISVVADGATQGGSVDWAFDNVSALFQSLGLGEVVTLSYDITVDDGQGGVLTRTVDINVEGMNDGPVAQASAITGDEDTVITGSVTATDADANAVLTYMLESRAANGSVVMNADGTYSYTGGADFNGTDSFTYRVVDQFGLSSVETVTVTVDNVNDAPTLAAGALDAVEDGAAVTLDLAALGADIDPGEDGATLTYSLLSGPAEGSASITGTSLTFDPGANFQTLPAGATRDVTVLVMATDADGATAINDVTITVTGTNDVPTITGTAVQTVREDQTLTASGQLNISDPDQGEASFQGFGTTLGDNGFGSFSMSAGGNWTYNLNNNHAAVQALNDGQFLRDTITVLSADGSGSREIAVRINGTNDINPTQLFLTFRQPYNSRSTFDEMLFENLTVRVDGAVTGYSTWAVRYGSLSGGNDVFLNGNIGSFSSTLRYVELNLGVHDDSGRIQLNYLYSGGDNVSLNGTSNGAVDNGEGVQLQLRAAGTGTVTFGDYRNNGSVTNNDYVGTYTNSARQVIIDYQKVGNTLQVQRIQDPVVLDLGGDGFDFLDLDAGVTFDLDYDGVAESVTWVSGTDGMLAIDLDGSGTIDNGAELLSEAFAGGSFGTSMAALRSLDENADGVLDAQDAAFADMVVWQDANENGVTDAGELTSLLDMGVDHFDLTGSAPEADSPDEVVELAELVLTDGSVMDYAGVELASAPEEILLPDAPITTEEPLI
ncbi:VCBS domain-containing protein, partial [Tropicibacter naphthalenivorans]